ncbi:hypothetical protein PAPYR_12091 [Paratrimastix pyriformis]|uniref:Uncharacterized protein n=1 Tax=Paratrimastix pyriformis TaxID=342808 RepID=A0ABQ8U532_9EUKA|nr:hypothetical protein PAPYR_12091 [Paratrimastix pyriformis]
MVASRGNMISKLIADFVLPEDHLEPLLLPKGEEPEPGRVAPPRKNVPKARAKPPTRPTTKNLTSPTKEETPSTRLRTRKHGTILDDDQASESGVDKKQPRKEVSRTAPSKGMATRKGAQDAALARKCSTPLHGKQEPEETGPEEQGKETVEAEGDDEDEDDEDEGEVVANIPIPGDDDDEDADD